MLAWRCSRLAGPDSLSSRRSGGVGPAAVARELLDDRRDLRRCAAVFSDPTIPEAQRLPWASITPHVPTAIRTRAAMPISPCIRPARRIMARWGSVQSFLVVSSRRLAHSHSEGRKRFSGLEFQSCERSASKSSARPRRVSRCLRVSQSRSE